MSLEVQKVLLSPLTTEKTERLSHEDASQRVFRVDINATKGDIRLAVESLFKVKVTQVRTMRVPGKLRRQGRWQGYVSDWKKAIVTIAKGQTLDMEKV